MFFVLFGVFSLLLLIFYLRNVTYYKKRRKLLDDVPSPPGLPIIGHALEIRSSIDAYNKMQGWTKQYVNVYKLEVGPIVQYVVSDPKIIEHVITNNITNTKGSFYKFMTPWLRFGTVTSNGEKNRKRRKVILPTISNKNMLADVFIPIFNRCCRDLVEKLRESAGKSSVELHHFLSLCCLDIVCQSTMGTPINAQTQGQSDYVESVMVLPKIIVERTFSLIGQIDWLFYFTSSYWKQKKYLKVAHDFSNGVIKKRREELLKKVDGNYNNKRKDFFLDMLLRAEIDGKPLSDEDIREEVDTIIVAGYDTAATSTSFTLYCLAQHQEVQRKAFEEIDAVLDGDRDKEVTYSDLQQMKYLDLVIKESLRLYSPVLFVGREVTEEFESGGYTFLKGTSILFYIQGVHMDPKNYKDPEKFDPDRWFENESNSFSFMPFSYGARSCIGQIYGLLELKLTIAKTLMHFKLLPSKNKSKMVLSSELVLKSMTGVHVDLEERKKSE